jgi:hypothetical protein
MSDQSSCPKCGATRSRVVGRSVSPPAFVVLVVECAACGYTSLAPVPDAPVQHSKAVDRRRIERLVKEAIDDLQEAAELVAVTDVADGWEITISRRPRTITQFILRSGPLSEMRAVIRKSVAGPASAI